MYYMYGCAVYGVPWFGCQLLFYWFAFWFCGVDLFGGLGLLLGC